MRKDFPADAAPATLLEALALEVRGDPALAAEWDEAQRAWPRSADDPRAEARFREWFLLEREARALGMPPAAAWAPAELGERDEDPWTRLLEAQFRVLRVETSGPDEAARLVDLWSGLAFEAVALPAEACSAALLLARVAPRGVSGGDLLPGWRALADEALASALAGDLARARAEQPRARLSQRECELLLAPRAAAARARADAADFLRRLEGCLAGAPEWPLPRALALLEQEGASALLDRLAFESGVPLEPVRRLLAEWSAAAAREAAPDDAVEPADDALDPQRVDRALEAYDRARAGGASLQEAWSGLREALDLDLGEEIEGGFPAAEGVATPTGPDALPGLGFWLDAWRWERTTAGQAPTAAETAVAREFASFAEGLRRTPMDAFELSAEDLWSFLAASPDESRLRARERDLASLVAWLRDEQGAFQAADPAQWSPADRARLHACVTVNAALRTPSGAHPVAARVAAVNPPSVATEQGDLAVAAGLPDRAQPPILCGDLLLGCWEAGRFRVAAWYPQMQPAAETAH